MAQGKLYGGETPGVGGYTLEQVLEMARVAGCPNTDGTCDESTLALTLIELVAEKAELEIQLEKWKTLAAFYQKRQGRSK